MAAKNKVTLGYWDCRGLAHSSILMLEYLEKPYEFKNPSNDLVGPPPTYAKTKWLEAKHEILKGFDFPNLPYYEDPNLDIKITQSNAILMHIGRTNNLFPNNEEVAQMNGDLLRQEINDLFGLLTGLVYDPNAAGKIPNYVTNMKQRLGLLEKKFKSADGKWFLECGLTYVDFMAYEFIDHNRILFPTILDDLEALKEFMDEFENLPTIKTYLTSKRFKKFPLWSVRSFLGRF